MSDNPNAADELQALAKHIPLGHECRSCGAATYNHYIRIAHFLRTGEACCATMRACAQKAKDALTPPSPKDK